MKKQATLNPLLILMFVLLAGWVFNDNYNYPLTTIRTAH